MKPLFLLCAASLVLYLFFAGNPDILKPEQASEQTSLIINNQPVIEAFENKRHDVQVSGSGVVVKVLPDDTKGSRHQKFILKLASDLTVLVAHNIDLAPRIPALRAGDVVEFHGEYEWNPKGGVIHWTHHDPSGHHEAGWLRHDGVSYQ